LNFCAAAQLLLKSMGNSTSSKMPPLEEFNALHPRDPRVKCLGHGTDAMPSSATGQLIKIHFDSNWLKISTKIYTTPNNTEYAGGIELKRHNKTRVRLLDGQGRSIAECIQLNAFSTPKCRVYGTKAKFIGQKPSVDHRQINGDPLYEWANVKMKGGEQGFQMKMVNDGGDSPTSRDDILRTVQVPGPTGPIILITRGDQPAGYFRRDRNFLKGTDMKWDVTISPGVDPYLVLSLIVSMTQIERRNERDNTAAAFAGALVTA